MTTEKVTLSDGGQEQEINYLYQPCLAEVVGISVFIFWPLHVPEHDIKYVRPFPGVKDDWYKDVWSVARDAFNLHGSNLDVFETVGLFTILDAAEKEEDLHGREESKFSIGTRAPNHSAAQIVVLHRPTL